MKLDIEIFSKPLIIFIYAYSTDLATNNKIEVILHERINKKYSIKIFHSRHQGVVKKN